MIKESKTYNPFISIELKEIFNFLNSIFPYASKCISDTCWLNDFMIHQVLKTYIVIEIEKDTALFAFYSLKEKYKKVFFEPDEKIFDLYTSFESRPIIVKTLISQSPIKKYNGVVIPKLEKTLVDLTCEDDLYCSQQSEFKIIFDNVKEKYSLTEKTLFRYANRRNSKLLNTLNKIIDTDKK